MKKSGRNAAFNYFFGPYDHDYILFRSALFGKKSGTGEIFVEYFFEPFPPGQAFPGWSWDTSALFRAMTIQSLCQKMN
jgi:hypothetical protein